jgi:hypothetical protein
VKISDFLLNKQRGEFYVSNTFTINVRLKLLSYGVRFDNFTGVTLKNCLLGCDPIWSGRNFFRLH